GDSTFDVGAGLRDKPLQQIRGHLLVLLPAHQVEAAFEYGCKWLGGVDHHAESHGIVGARRRGVCLCMCRRRPEMQNERSAQKRTAKGSRTIRHAKSLRYT